MIVLDASALVELVLNTPTGRAIADRIGAPALGLHIPHLADIEVAQALRRYAQKGEIDDADAMQALADLRALDLQRHAHEPLLDRVWELRRNLSAYDAVYIALAEVLDTILLTCDGPLARAPGMAARVELVAPPEDSGLTMVPQTVDEQIRFAIANRRLVRVRYNGTLRVAEPHDYGIQSGKARLLVYQVRPTARSSRKSTTRWRLLDVAKIEECAALEETFLGSRGHSHQRHRVWDVVYARVA